MYIPEEGTLNWLQSLPTSELKSVLSKMPKEKSSAIILALKDRKQEEKIKDDDRSRDANRKSKKRALERDIIIPSIANPSRRVALEADDAAWLRHYLPNVFTFDFTRQQHQQVNAVGDCLRYGTQQAIAAPRGDGKTSITRGLLLKFLLTGECPFALYVGESDPKAKQSEGSIKRWLRTGCYDRNRIFQPATPLGEDYPFQCSIASYVSKAPSRANNCTCNGGKQIHVQWAGDQIILPSLEIDQGDPNETWDAWMLKPGMLGAILLATGVTGSLLQGANVLDMRPRFVVLDDLDKRGSLASEEGKHAGKVEDIIDKTISGMRGQGHSMGQVMLCTVTSRDSVAFKYTDPEAKPTWSGYRLKRLLAKPKNEGLWDEYIQLRQKGKKTLGEDGKPEDRYGRTAHQFYLDRFDEMNEDAIVGNDHVHDESILPDGSRTQETSLQWCYDFIADNSEEAFETEYQQTPPEEEGIDRLVLSAYHVQHNARSGLDKNIVPHETIGIACGLDIKKVGFHYVVWAFSDTPTQAACIDYGFHETKFAGDNLRVEDAERAILNGLHEWREDRDNNPYLDIDGEEFLIDLALIDQGWKHESWASQPADHFCAEAGLNRFMPCKGWGDGQYRRPTAGTTRKVLVGDNCHVSFSGNVPHVNWNTDHWKMKIHEGFLTPAGEPGSLSLFTPSQTKSRRSQPHMSFAKHITAHVWEERFVPGYRGLVAKWWKDGSQDHYLDAASQGLVARSLLGATTLTPNESLASEIIVPVPQPAPQIIGNTQRAW